MSRSGTTASTPGVSDPGDRLGWDLGREAVDDVPIHVGGGETHLAGQFLGDGQRVFGVRLEAHDEAVPNGYWPAPRVLRRGGRQSARRELPGSVGTRPSRVSGMSGEDNDEWDGGEGDRKCEGGETPQDRPQSVHAGDLPHRG